MARATFVKAAQKDYPEHGIKKGEPYYWWKFRFGGKHYSKTAPRPSQLTQSDFLGQQLALAEEIEALTTETVAEDVNDIASRIRELGQEQDDKRSNMPDALQDGDTGQLLQDRYDACEAWADELESAANDYPEEEEGDAEPEEGETAEEAKERQAEEREQALQDWLDTVTACEYQGE